MAWFEAHSKVDQADPFFHFPTKILLEFQCQAVPFNILPHRRKTWPGEASVGKQSYETYVMKPTSTSMHANNKHNVEKTS